MDVIEAVTSQPSTLLGCQKEELELHRNSSPNIVNTSALGNVLHFFDVIVLPGTNHSGKPLIGISQRFSFRKESLKSISCCQQRGYHQPSYRKSTRFNKKSSFVGKVPRLSASCFVGIRAGADQLGLPGHAGLKLPKKLVSKSDHQLISLSRPATGVRKCQGISDSGCVQATDKVSTDPLFHDKSDITRGSLETCNLIRSKPQKESAVSQQIEAGNLEFVFVTYDMEEPAQPPHPVLESANEELEEEYDPFYKCAFQFAKKHGYGFVEFVEEKVPGKKPKKHVVRKKYQPVNKDDRINPVYSVSSGSKKCRIHRDRCLAKPKATLIGLSQETSPFKLADYEKTKAKKACHAGGNTKTRSLPLKNSLPEFIKELSPRLKKYSKTKSTIAVDGASMLSPGRVNKNDITQTSPSSLNNVRKNTSGRPQKGPRKTGKTLNKMSARSASAVVGDLLHPSKDIYLTAERDKTYTFNSQSLDDKTVDSKCDRLKQPALRENYLQQQKGSQEKTQTVLDRNTSQKNLSNSNDKISGAVVEEPALVKKSNTILPRLKDVTSLTYKLCNSISATIFRETQLAQKMVATRNHSEKLTLAHVDVVHFAYKPVHSEDRDRAPSCECPTRHQGRAHRKMKSSQCTLSAGSSTGMCARRKSHVGMHDDHSSQVKCDRAESWPSLVEHHRNCVFICSKAKIATCASPPMAKVLSTVGDSPTKFEVNCDSPSKILPEYKHGNLENGVNEQGLDLKLPADSGVRCMIFPASVPQVREHCRLRQSVGPYNFEDGDIKEMADSLLLYISKSCKILNKDSKSRVPTFDKTTCGKRTATSTISQASVNNNKCAGYCKDLADIYGECSYSYNSSFYESPDSSSNQDTNNNAVLHIPEASDQNLCNGCVRNKPGLLVNSERNQTASKNKAIKQKHHCKLMRLPVFFQRLEKKSACQLHTCHHDIVVIPAGTTGTCRKNAIESKMRKSLEIEINSRQAFASLTRGCKHLPNCCTVYAKNMVRNWKKKKSCKPSLSSKSGRFLLKYKQSDFETDWLVASQYTAILDGNNNNSNNLRKRPSLAHKTTVRYSRARMPVQRKDIMRQTRKNKKKHGKTRSHGVRKTTYSITSKGMKALRDKTCDTATYSIGPSGYKTLYETLRKRCNTPLHQPAPHSQSLCRRIAVCCSCNVLDNMVDSFRHLITLFPEKRLQTLQKILGLTVKPRSATNKSSHSSTESRCSSSSSNVNKDANTSKSQRDLCKQRPGTIYQSLVPSSNTCCNNMINALSYGYCYACGRPGLMSEPVKSYTSNAVHNGVKKRVRIIDLQPVDSLTLAKERLSKGKDAKETKPMSKSNNASENACSRAGENDGGSNLPSNMVNDEIETPVIDPALYCKQHQMANDFPVTQQPANWDMLPGIQNLECEKHQFRNYLWPSKLVVESDTSKARNIYKPKTIKWNLSLQKDVVDTDNDKCKQQSCLFSGNPEDSSQMGCEDSWKGVYYLQSCINRSTQMCRGNTCDKTTGSALQSGAEKFDTYESVLKRQSPRSDCLELRRKEHSGSPRNTLSRSPRTAVKACEYNMSEGCTKTVTAQDLETEHSNQAPPMEILNTVTGKLVTEFFKSYSAGGGEDTSMEHTENSDCLKQRASSSYSSDSRQHTKTRSNTKQDGLTLPDSDVIIPECLEMSSYDPEGSNHSAVISRDSVTHLSSLQQTASSGSIEMCSCNSQGSACAACTTPHPVPSGSSLQPRVNSGPTNMGSCNTQGFSCSACSSADPVPTESSLQEVDVPIDQKRAASTNSIVNVMNVLDNTQFASQPSDASEERISTTDSSDLSLSSVFTQPYLKVNSEGISTHWVCVLLDLPPLHTCSSPSGNPHFRGSDNNSTCHCSTGSDDSGSLSSFSMAVATSSRNYQNLLNSTDDETEEADTHDENLTPRESFNAAEVIDICNTTISSRNQHSSSHSIASSESSSQCNNNNIVPSLPFLGPSELHGHGAHLETVWRPSRREVGNSPIQGRLAIMSSNRKRPVTSGNTSISMQLLRQNTDHGSLFHANHEGFLSGNHEILPDGNHENLLSGNHEIFPSGNNEILPGGNHENMLSGNHDILPGGNHENLLSGNNEIFSTGSHENLLSGNHENLPSGNHEILISANRENLLSANHENLLSGNHEKLLSANRANLLSGNHKFQIVASRTHWLDVNHEISLDINHENSQAFTFNILHSKAATFRSRKRRMNTPLDDMASPPKIRRLNSSLLQELDQ